MAAKAPVQYGLMKLGDPISSIVVSEPSLEAGFVVVLQR
jgi:hypothetical protein